MPFGRREEEKVSTTQSVIAKDLLVKGDITCEGIMRIEGSIEGNILGNGEITVAETGRVKGDIKGRKVVVMGHIEGNITAKENVEVIEKAVVIGDIVADKISIEEGASVEGKFITKKQDTASQILPKEDKTDIPKNSK